MKHGFCTDRLARIESFLQEKYIATGKLPGTQVQVLRNGSLVYESVIGRRDVERNEPLTRDTVYRIYSMTKPITSLVFMMLVEEGRVALDDPVTRFIPEWKNLGVYSAGTGPWVTTPCARPMQMVDLLRHTSGLTYGFQMRTNVDAAYRTLKVADRDRSLNTERFVDELSRIPLEFSPGDAWNYSVSTDVLGVLIERITGKPFAQVLQERVFDPLGMKDTRFVVGQDQQARFAACYLPTPQGGMSLLDDPQKSPYLSEPVFFSGGGGLVSTADDYMRFCRMLLAGGQLDGHTLVSPATLRLMTANHLPGGKDLTALSRSLFSESTNAGVGFGLGFAVVFDPVRAMVPSSPGEYYWGGAASTAFWIDPVEDIAVVFMTQLLGSSTYPVRRELRTLVYSALLEPRQRRY